MSVRWWVVFLMKLCTRSLLMTCAPWPKDLFCCSATLRRNSAPAAVPALLCIWLKPAQLASEIETQLSALQVVVYLNQIVRTDVCCVRWEWRTLWMWNYVIIINKPVPRTRWRSLKVGHSVQTILQRPLIIMFQRARFLDSLFFPDH